MLTAIGTAIGLIVTVGGAAYAIVRSRVDAHTENESFMVGGGTALIVKNGGTATVLVQRIAVVDAGFDRLGLFAGTQPGPDPWTPGEPYPVEWKTELEPNIEVLPGHTERYSFLFGTFRSDRSSCRISIQIDERRFTQLFKSRTITVMQSSITTIDTGK